MSKRPMDDATGHMQCPFCGAYEVDRLFIGTVHLDSCTCQGCGARWDEDAGTGRYRGRSAIESVMAPRER
jgi:transposase-like protein